MCDVGDKNAVPVEDYLLNIDQCLHNNNCLSYHQILSYKHKVNDNHPVVMPQMLLSSLQVYYYETKSQNEPPDGVELPYYEDLQLAEINYICIIASIDETP